MARIYAIALNTFREAVRDRILHAVVGLASAVLVFGLALGQLSLHQEIRVVMDLGIASVSLFSIVVALFLGSSLLYKEMERKTLYVILPRPLRRWEFLVGKYVGILLTIAVFIALTGGVQAWVLAVQADASWTALALAPIGLVMLLVVLLLRSSDRTTLLLPFSAAFFASCMLVLSMTSIAVEPIVAASILTLGEVAVLAAVALFFSSFSTPFTTAALTFGIWLVGRSAGDIVTMQGGVLPESIRSMLEVVAEVAPNFNLFFPGRHVLMESGEAWHPWPYVAEALGYGALYSAIALTMASWVFRRRDLL